MYESIITQPGIFCHMYYVTSAATETFSFHSSRTDRLSF